MEANNGPLEETEVTLSPGVDDRLSGGVGRALFYTSERTSASSLYDVLFDERANRFGPTVLLDRKPVEDLTLFVRHMVSHLDLTVAELVTAHVLYESFLRSSQHTTASLYCVRLLMTGLAMKTTVDTVLNTNSIAVAIERSGFQLHRKQLGRMESVILKKLDYKIIHPSRVYEVYAMELTKLHVVAPLEPGI